MGWNSFTNFREVKRNVDFMLNETDLIIIGELGVQYVRNLSLLISR